jgi:A/G-specific adenine glycosylase
VCTPAAVSCSTCPVAKHCRAHREQRVHELPIAKAKPAPQLRELVATLVRDARGEKLLLVRSDAGLFAGLWNLPMREGRGWQSAATLLAEHGVRAKLKRAPCAELDHVLTHRRLHIRLFVAELEQLEPKPELRLQPEAALHELGVSRLTHKALAAARVAESVRI